MSLISIFATEPEVVGFLHAFALKRHLVGAVSTDGGYRILDPKQDAFEVLREPSTTKFYLMPRVRIPNDLSKQSVQPKLLGWTDVWVGHFMEQADVPNLTCTTIQVTRRKDLPFDPAAWLRAFKKDLSASLTFGTDAVNVVYGGRGVYADVGYSAAALRLYQNGVKWKQEGVNNIEYLPGPQTAASSPMSGTKR